MTLLRLAFVAALVTALLRPVPGRAEIGAYLLFDMADGTVLAEYEATAVWYPASITKLMTAFVTFQAIEKGELKLTSPVRISPQANQQPPSRMGFPVGTVLTIDTALRILMTKSANDVAFALAETVGGTLGGFVDRMNAAAADIGMTATMYDNPHGLPNTKQVTTARDIAMLMMALQDRYPERADFFSMNSVRLGTRTITNHNALLRQVPGADGMKTGFICASGFNVAAAATRDGRRLGAVVLGGLTSTERNERTGELLEKGFEALPSGGTIALDGFDEPDGRLALRPVWGERRDLGTVMAMANPVDADAVDRRSEVCGSSRPITRYSDGTVDTVAEVESQRVAVGAYKLKLAAREVLKEEALSAPRTIVPVSIPSTAPPRRIAEAELIPAGWTPAAPTLLPPFHPARSALAATDAAADAVADRRAEGDTPPTGAAKSSTVAESRAVIPTDPNGSPLSYGTREGVPTSAEAATTAAMAVAATDGLSPPPGVGTGSSTPAKSDGVDLGPEGWQASPSFPIPNPLEVADVRHPLAEPAPSRPLTYLRARYALAPYPIALGGADDERPEPLSGAIVGGGPAPLPPLRPATANADPAETEREGDVT